MYSKKKLGDEKMNQEEQGKKTKEQIRMEKQKNASIIPMSKQTRSSLNIMGFQPDDNVFHLRDVLYLKIYSIDNDTLTEEKKVAFIEAIGLKSTLRMRVTSLHKLRGEKYNKLFFLSVFVEAANYTEAYEQYQEFEEQIQELNSDKYGISVTPCSIEYAMMYIIMNISGNLKKYDIQLSIRKREDWKNTVFPELKDMEGLGYKDITSNKYGICYRGTEYPSKLEGLYQKICALGIEFKSCIDFQKMNEQERKMYQKRLEQKYNYQFTEDNKEPLVCATFLFSVTADDYEELLAIKEKLLSVFEQHSLIMSPCPEQQKEAYYSLGSLGMTEYRTMRIVNMEVISRLPV